ncbi:MAG: amidohydrolase family protein, partial [Rubricoccaceae bacterium]|nr:amidohydrolase family protein [Rubricoccaceae bacterium]
LTRRLHDAGVPLAAGSDLPNPHVIPGASLHEELRLLHAAGIPPLDVLRIATHNGAAALGLADRTGSVEVGKEADLVVLTADPTADLRHTRSIEIVLLDGQLLRPSDVLADR